MPRTKQPPISVQAEDLALLADGSLTVRRAEEFSGISRSRLFELMKDGVLPWFTCETDNTRLIPRKPLVEYLAKLYASHRHRSSSRIGPA